MTTDLKTHKATQAAAPVARTVQVYEEIAPVYDDRYTSPTALAENEAVRDLVGALAVPGREGPPSVLDIGAGTGLALDLGITSVDRYLGVDPAAGMLDRLTAKHPGARIVHGTLTDAVMAHRGERFDLVLALFGVGSYLSAEDVAAIPLLLSEGGAALVMTYHGAYLPDYYVGVPPSTAGEAHMALAMTFTEVGVLSGKYGLWTVRR